ncbi:glycosyltransferase WbuB, partial [Escherichia coli]|nr:glycosyltransferase WbuB [Escherichia coli]
SSKELHEMGERAHQLFKDKYTREINTMKYYNLLK